MKLDTKFSLHQRVTITELETVGRVRNIQISIDGVAYKVSFYIDGERNDEWLYEDELEAA